MRYAVFDLATGEWLREVLKSSGPPTAREGEGVLPLPLDFVGNDTTHRVENGELVPLA